MNKLIKVSVWLPLQIYLICRLAGGKGYSGYENPLSDDKTLYAYAIVEVVTLIVSCIWAFLDMLKWLRGGAGARVWGWQQLPTRNVCSRWLSHAHKSKP